MSEIRFKNIKELRAQRYYPSVTIIIPTHRRMPEREQDTVRLNNAIQKTEKLLQQAPESDRTACIKKLKQIAAKIDFENIHDNIMIFVNQDYEHVYYGNSQVKERVIVADRFYLSDYIREELERPHAWLLSLSTGDVPEGATRLFDIQGAIIGEVVEPADHDGFPYWRREPEPRERFAEGTGDRDERYEDERRRKFFERVDHLLEPFLAQDDRPVFVVGTERNTVFYRTVTKHTARIACMKAHGGELSYNEQKNLIRELFHDYCTQQRVRVYDIELDQARGEDRVLFGVREVWRAAQEGRILKLLIEPHDSLMIKMDPQIKTHPVFYEHNDTPKTFEIHDEIVMTTLEKRGSVLFFNPGDLREYDGIVAILRY